MRVDAATGYWPPPSEDGAAERPTIPGYEILAELGRGGMGVVYKARQASSERFVALKIIRDSALASPDERARFRIEAEAASRMKHPHIVAISEISEHAGRPYFVMELVEGGSLDKHLAGQPKPAAQAAELLRSLALAVQHAHEQRIIHRDLKPGNVLLDEHGSPKITDFGLAKRLDSDSTALTREGSVLGTASYMAPEQAEGRVGDIGPATDVYALGAILYELLTGRPPFQADSWNQIVQQVLHEEPAAPARLQPNVPRDLETICLKCLEKEAGRRYASAAELAEDLDRFLKGRPVAAVPLGETERLERLAKRDGYQIIAVIGRGPQSTVYHALEGPLKQAVALKVYRADVCTREEWENWLRRTADACSGLAHPHIVPIRQAGWWDGCPYLVLEHVPHGSLAAKLNGRPYPMPQALRLIEQLAEIIGYLHRQGVIHGNLKPSNVLFAADSIPRVADYRPPFVHDVEPIGLGYLAPERVRETGADPRPYTDIYGLGIILYELLTGRPPFAGTSAQEVLEQVRSQDPLPPSLLNTKVTPQLEACCLRCLRKDPWRRYHRVYDLLRRLRYFQDNSDASRMADER